MFTGLIEEVGTVESIARNAQSCTLVIRAQTVLEDAAIGDSIAVNGVCLTVTSYTPTRFQADVMPETWQVTALSQLKPGSLVNLERALQLGARLGGHLVSGHVDGVGTIISRNADHNAIRFQIRTGPELLRQVIPRGSITVDGISLTVTEAGDEHLAVSVIPHTLAQTNLRSKKVGDVVNLETDLIAKYVERLLTGRAGAARSGADGRGGKPGAGRAGIDLAFLEEHGYA